MLKRIFRGLTWIIFFIFTVNTSIKSQVVNAPSTRINNLLSPAFPFRLGSKSDFIKNVKYHIGDYTIDFSGVFTEKLAFNLSSRDFYDLTELKKNGLSEFDILKPFYLANGLYNYEKIDSLKITSRNFFKQRNKKNLLQLDSIEEEKEFNYIIDSAGNIIYVNIINGTPSGFAVIEDTNQNIIIGFLDRSKSLSINSIGMIKFSNGNFYFGEIKNNLPTFVEHLMDIKGETVLYPKQDQMSNYIKYRYTSNGKILLSDGSVVECELDNGKPIGIGRRYNFKSDTRNPFELVTFNEIGKAILYKIQTHFTQATLVNPTKATTNKESNSNSRNENVVGSMRGDKNKSGQTNSSSAIFSLRTTCKICNEGYIYDSGIKSCTNCDYWTKEQQRFNYCSVCRNKRYIIYSQPTKVGCTVCKKTGEIVTRVSPNFKELIQEFCYTASSVDRSCQKLCYEIRSEQGRLQFAGSATFDYNTLSFYFHPTKDDRYTLNLKSNGTVIVERYDNQYWTRGGGKWNIVDGKFKLELTIMHRENDDKLNYTFETNAIY